MIMVDGVSQGAAELARKKFYERIDGQPLRVTASLQLMKLAGSHGVAPPPDVTQGTVQPSFVNCAWS